MTQESKQPGLETTEPEETAIVVVPVAAPLAAPPSAQEVEALRGDIVLLGQQVRALEGVVQSVLRSLEQVSDELHKTNKLQERRGATLDYEGNVVLGPGERGGIFGP